MPNRPATRRRLFAFLAPLLLLACVSASAPAPRGPAMVAAADPRAVEAGLEMLREGGTATDAAIAAMAVLGLVEPQSAGVGGGGFLLHYDGASEAIAAYDGRERAPAGATPQLFLDEAGERINFLDAVASGLSIGTPSLFAMLKRAHEEHGRLPWARLFEPAIALADEGFVISPRMANAIAGGAQRGRLRDDPAALAYLFDASGAPWPVGHVLRNPAYAATLRAIASEGPRALTDGPIAEEIIAVAQRGPRGSTMTLADLQAYQPRVLEPVCGTFRIYRVCGMPPPSSGGIAVINILGLYERARPVSARGDTDDWSAYLSASLLAYADREHYIADDTIVPVPTQDLIAPAYLDERARLIDPAHAISDVAPGMPAGRAFFERWGRDSGDTSSGTTHLSIVDGEGNAVALTATIESGFGSRRMAAGFFLNNQLTDFTFTPEVDGRPVANAVGPGKRPRSSMSPTIVLDRDGELVMVTGSPGGPGIIAYVARTLIATLDWGLGVQQAIDQGHGIARSQPVRLEAARLPPELAPALTARGWQVREIAQENSGLHAIRVTPDGLEGGADPRREGVARGLD